MASNSKKHLKNSRPIELWKLEEEIGYTFKNQDLLVKALTHTSYAYEHDTESYERLEYLGDSILEFISSKYLYENYDKLTEGEMTKVRAYSVCEDSLYQVAISHNFGNYLFLGNSEKGMHGTRKAILADTVEAVIAAIYLDSGLEEAEKFILNNIKNQIEYATKHVGTKDYKTVLQEKLQAHGDVSIKYNIIDERGPDHKKTFTAEIEIEGHKMARGVGSSKKNAEMEAARKTLEMLK